jgi:hypothetical protein
LVAGKPSPAPPGSSRRSTPFRLTSPPSTGQPSARLGGLDHRLDRRLHRSTSSRSACSTSNRGSRISASVRRRERVPAYSRSRDRRQTCYHRLL